MPGGRGIRASMRVIGEHARGCHLLHLCCTKQATAQFLAKERIVCNRASQQCSLATVRAHSEHEIQADTTSSFYTTSDTTSRF